MATMPYDVQRAHDVWRYMHDGREGVGRDEDRAGRIVARTHPLLPRAFQRREEQVLGFAGSGGRIIADWARRTAGPRNDADYLCNLGCRLYSSVEGPRERTKTR